MLERTKTAYYAPSINPAGTLLRLQAQREEISAQIDTCHTALVDARATRNTHMIKVLREICHDLSAERRKISREILDVMDHDAREYLEEYRSLGLPESEEVIQVLEERRENVQKQREILDTTEDDF